MLVHLEPELSGKNPGIDAMLELWHTLCRENLGNDIGVGIASRRDAGMFPDQGGEVNTALPRLVRNKPTLVLFVENLSHVKAITITHEIGHWVLKLQGFDTFRDGTEPNSGNEILFNSMCHHPALYRLQQSLGQDPRKEINTRANHDLSLLMPNPMQPTHTTRTLVLADDVLNCSKNMRKKIFNVLGRHYPRTSETLREILDVQAKFDPSELETYRGFADSAAKLLGFGHWRIQNNEINRLKDFAKTARISN